MDQDCAVCNKELQPSELAIACDKCGRVVHAKCDVANIEAS